MAPIAPSREVPLVFTGGCLLGADSSESSSRGEAKRYVSIKAEKRLRAPDGGLESLSVKEDSDQDKRFLEKQCTHNSHVISRHSQKLLYLACCFSLYSVLSAHISGDPVLQLLSLRVTLPKLSLLATRSSLGVLCSRRVTIWGLCSS